MTTRLLLTLLAAAAIAIVAIGAAVRDRVSGRDVLAVFATAGGLREGGPVSYLGVHAGSIRHIDLSSGRVVVTMRLFRSDVVLRRDDSVRVRVSGLMSEPGLDIIAGPRRAPLLGAADTLHGVPQPVADLSRRIDSIAEATFRASLHAPPPAGVR